MQRQIKNIKTKHIISFVMITIFIFGLIILLNQNKELQKDNLVEKELPEEIQLGDGENSFDSANVNYDNSSSGLTSTKVQAALNELAASLPNCFNSPFKLGDYFSLTPTKTTFTIKASTTGYSSDQTITPSELSVWRVIDIHCDGSVDAVSEYISSTLVYFSGTIGYANLVSAFQAIASSYAKENYTISTRIMGYGGQTPTIQDTSAFDGTINSLPSTDVLATPSSGIGQEYSEGLLGDTLYLNDYQLVSNVYITDTSRYGENGLKGYKVGGTSAMAYYLASRRYSYSNSTTAYCSIRAITPTGSFISSSLRTFNGVQWTDGSSNYRLRPIITLKSGVIISSGGGTRTSPYVLN